MELWRTILRCRAGDRPPSGSPGRGGQTDDHATMGARPLGDRSRYQRHLRQPRSCRDDPNGGGAHRGPSAAAVALAMAHAGVLDTDDQVLHLATGTPHGGIVSPILATA